MPTVVSTFAGCGGSTLGYRQAGYEELLAVEWDKNAIATFNRNFPGIHVHGGDIAKLTGKMCLALAGLEPRELDVLDGSPPCQGFSMAGKRWLDDPRNSLFREYLRILRVLKPKVFVMENVPGLIRGAMRKTYLAMLEEFRRCGYRSAGAVMNAMYFGVPQNRQRVIVIGVREDLGVEPSHPKPTTVPAIVSAALEGMPVDDSRTLSDQGLLIWVQLRPGEEFRKYHPKSHWFNAKKLDPARPAQTITKTVMKGGAAGLFHWRYPRTLNVAELKRLASFPDDFQFDGKLEDVWARVGNSVPPLLMKAIADHIRTEILGRAP